MKKFVLAVVSVVAIFSMTSCGSSGHQLRGGTPPKWTMRGSGVWKCKIDGRKGFCSLGIVDHVMDIGLRRKAAAERARAELVQYLDTYVASLYKDYLSSTSDTHDVSEEQHIQRTFKTFAAGHISGVEVADYWENEKGAAFALGFLSLDGFKDLLNKIKDLNAQARQAIVNRAEKAFDELNMEE